MMGPDLDGNGNAAGIFAREDFTLLNLSRSSSASTSDELFGHHQHPLPVSNLNAKKKKLRLKRRSGQSIRRNRTGDTSSQSSPRNPSFSSVGCCSSNVSYIVLMFLLCWLATLSWLILSVKNELAATTHILNTHEEDTKEFPVELLKFNQTLESLESNITSLTLQIQNLQAQIASLEKNASEEHLLVEQVQKNLGQLGSREKELEANLEKLIALNSTCCTQLTTIQKDSSGENKSHK